MSLAPMADPLTLSAAVGILGVDHGGTGLASYTLGDLIYASGATTLSKLADVATGNALISGGVGVAPAWGKIALTTHISGILPIANGGTNSSTALSGSSIMVSNGTGVVQGAAGTTTTVLHGNAAGAPTYGAVSLTADISGILPSANGGTGVNNAGTFTNASSTTITGGGTVALGGFTLTVPATGTAALLATANAFTAAQTVTAANGLTTLAAATQDALRIAGRAGGTLSYVATLTPTTLTASRTYTLPDLSLILAGSAGGLTLNCIPYVTTGGALTSSANLFYAGVVLNHIVDNAEIVVGGSTGSQAFVKINAAAGSQRGFAMQTAALSRWQFSVNGTAESGSAAGSDWDLYAYNDAGGYVDNPLRIYRVAGGAFEFNRPLTLSTLSGGLTIAKTTGTTLTVSSTTDATSSTAASVTLAGGLAVVKNIVAKQGRGTGVTSTATAAGTTTLTSASTEIQKFTGTSTQTVQFPAANLFGAGVAVLFTINNQSTMTVTPTSAGADTFVGGGTTDPVLTLASTSYASDGVSLWMKI